MNLQTDAELIALREMAVNVRGGIDEACANLEKAWAGYSESMKMIQKAEGAEQSSSSLSTSD